VLLSLTEFLFGFDWVSLGFDVGLVDCSYSFGGLESDKTGSPYLAHVNLGAGGGYQVPRRGTVQLTLFNPQGTVVKMFVVLFDLTHMPPNSKTFLRQRTYYMPGHETDQSPQAPKWLRYLIHLRYIDHVRVHRNVCHADALRLCAQVLQFENGPHLLAHGRAHHRAAQVGPGHGVGAPVRPVRRRLVRVEVVHARTVRAALLHPLTGPRDVTRPRMTSSSASGVARLPVQDDVIVGQWRRSLPTP